MGIFYQVIATCVTCYLCTMLGVMFTWPSCTLTIFSSANTTLNRPMSETELALFGSLSSVGALVSTPLTGYLLDRIGRKYCLIAASLTHVIAWALLAACHLVETVLVAVFLSGIGGAVFLVVPVYISEICQESIRGTMTAGSMIFYGVGMLISYLLGMMEYDPMIYVCLSGSVLGILFLGFLRETPLYLMTKGLNQEAAKSIAYFRDCKANSKEVLEEIEAIRRALNVNPDDDLETIPEHEKLNSVQTTKEKLSMWQYFKKSRSTRRALFVVTTLMIASICQGLVVIQVYAEPLFSEAVPTMSPIVSAVILAVVGLVVGCVAAFFTDICGRRPLMIYGSIATGVCCIILGTQLHLHWGPHWLTAVLIYLYTTVYTLGAGTVPYVLYPEVFLPEVKSFMSMVAIEIVWLCYSIVLFVFTPLMNAIGLGPTFYVFAAICFLTALFSTVFQPETKGLPIDEVQAKFLKKHVFSR